MGVGELGRESAHYTLGKPSVGSSAGRNLASRELRPLQVSLGKWDLHSRRPNLSPYGHSDFKYSTKSSSSSALSGPVPETFSGECGPVRAASSVSARPSCRSFTRL